MLNVLTNLENKGHQMKRGNAKTTRYSSKKKVESGQADSKKHVEVEDDRTGTSVENFEAGHYG